MKPDNEKAPLSSPPAVTITVALGIDANKNNVVDVKLQADAYELNLSLRFDEVPKLKDLPSFDSGARPIGTIAGSPAFWCADKGQVSILTPVGDECWDIGFWISAAAHQKIIEEARIIAQSGT